MKGEKRPEKDTNRDALKLARDFNNASLASMKLMKKIGAIISGAMKIIH